MSPPALGLAMLLLPLLRRSELRRFTARLRALLMVESWRATSFCASPFSVSDGGVMILDVRREKLLIKSALGTDTVGLSVECGGLVQSDVACALKSL
jgi:hypothetical protein